jgi:cell division protein FtsQ
MSRRNRIRTNRNLRLRRPAGKGAKNWVRRLGQYALHWLMVLSLVALGITAVRYSWPALTWKVGEVKILGCTNAMESELLELIQVDLRASLTDLDLKELSRRLARHPWIRQAQVKRNWARKALVIEVQERVPQAMILLDGLYFVDRQGEIFKRVESGDRLDLPILTGLKAQEIRRGSPEAMDALHQALDFLALLKQRKGFTPRDVSEVHLSRQKGLTVFTLREGMAIRLGFGEFKGKLDRLEKILPDLKRKVHRIESVDLNIPRRVVVRLKKTREDKARGS